MWFLAFTQFVSEWALTLLLAFICVAISSLAGLAGGILVLPILLFVKGEQPTVAVGLKSVALFGGALVNLMHHMGEKGRRRILERIGSFEGVKFWGTLCLPMVVIMYAFYLDAHTFCGPLMTVCI